MQVDWLHLFKNIMSFIIKLAIQSEDEIQGKVECWNDLRDGSVMVLIKNKVLCLKLIGNRECLVKVKTSMRVSKINDKDLVESMDIFCGRSGASQAFVASKNGNLSKVIILSHRVICFAKLTC